MPAAINGLRFVFLAGFVASFCACGGDPPATVAAAELTRSDASTPSAPTSIPTSLDSVAQQTAKPAAAQPAPRTTAATTKPAVQDGLPELVYVCPMPADVDVMSDKAGKCPKCGMTLLPVRVTPGWSCRSNNAFLSETPGKCKTDGTEMVPVNISVFFSCPSTPDVKELNPGKCADGKDRIRKIELFAHGDHNPKHGGVLFMADDGWHHIEGTYPSAGLVRAFFYNELTRPMTVKGFSASAVVKDAAGKEVSSTPMKVGRISNALEAQIPGAKLPLTVQLRVQFKPGDKERRFDFPPFTEYTKEPVAAPTSTTTVKPATTTAAKPATASTTTAKPAGQAPASSASSSSAAKPAATAPKPTAAPATSSAALQSPAPLPGTAPPQEPGADPMRQQQTLEIVPDKMIEIPVLPNTPKELLAELKKSNDELKALMDEGKTREIWVPALRTKDIAVKLADYVNDIPERQRPLATSAVNRVVRSAWELDDLGDLGDNEKIIGVYTLFMAAVNDLTTSYESVR
jgi:hypothetical protein